MTLTPSESVPNEVRTLQDLTHDVAATILICVVNHIAADIYRGRHRRNSHHLVRVSVNLRVKFKVRVSSVLARLL